MNPRLAALLAVILWSSLATLATSIPLIPPLFMTGVGLVVGSALSLPLAGFRLSEIKVSWRQLSLGVYGLFGYHAALFLALQTAPKVQANLVNYLWPLLIVLLSPLYIRGLRLKANVLIGSVIGFSGAAVAIASSGEMAGSFAIGYLFALIAAVVWATYSLGTRKFGEVPTASVGAFAFVAGTLALALHFILEPSFTPSSSDWFMLIVLGLGPLGAAFYFWDYAIKRGNPQQIGLISFLTPLLSTTMLLIATGEELSILLVVSAALIVGGAVIGRVKDGV